MLSMLVQVHSTQNSSCIYIKYLSFSSDIWKFPLLGGVCYYCFLKTDFHLNYILKYTSYLKVSVYIH